MIRKGTCVIVGAVVLIATGCGSGTKSGGSGAMTVNLGEQNTSGESGTARLTAQGDKTKIVLDLRSPSATMASETQPAHIHKGSCAKLDPTPAYALADVMDGKSVSVVDVKLDVLRQRRFRDQRAQVGGRDPDLRRVRGHRHGRHRRQQRLPVLGRLAQRT